MNKIASPIAKCQLTIVGLGLMGGSLALALRDKCAGITAVDSDAQARTEGLQHGAVSHATESLEEGVARADLLILAAPVCALVC